MAEPLGLEREVVDIAPEPVLAGLERLDDRVAGLAKVPGCVLSDGIVATPDMTAAEASPQVDPLLAGAQTLDAAVGDGGRVL